MSDESDARVNLRSNVQGHAVIHDRAGRFAAEILNVSLGGALLRVRDVGWLPATGTVVPAEVRLAGSERWFEVTARVRRRDPVRGVLAIEFAEANPALEDAIADVVLEGIDAADFPRVLLVDLDPDRRGRLARVLRRYGCYPVEAATPLEAIRHCEQSSVPIVGAAIVDGMAQSFGELADFLARTYTTAEVVRIDAASGGGVEDVRRLARSLRQWPAADPLVEHDA